MRLGRKPASRITREESGFTLVEIVVAAGVLMVGVLATVALIDVANAMTARTKTREAGLNLVREIAEAARAIPYSEVTQGTVVSALQSRPGLADDDSSASGWQLERRDRTYTVAVSVCTVDDQRDGLGVHGGSFCSGQATGTTDPHPDDYRRVTVALDWSLSGSPNQHVQQTTHVSSRGTADDPAVTDLTGSPGTPVLTDETSIEFTAATNMVANRVDWSVDGGVRGTASNLGDGGRWSFSWPLAGLTDGEYQLRADAYDSNNQSGGSQALTYKLNRFEPSAPAGFAAGLNSTAEGRRQVDTEWRLNPERDTVGYRVKRQAFSVGGNAQSVETVCGATAPLATGRSSCIDPAPPYPEQYPRVDYWAVALDEAPGGSLRESDSSDKVDAYRPNLPPEPPTALQARRTEAGTMLLSWLAPPAPEDPDTADGDSIVFYRVYRNGERYDRTGLGSDVTFEDPTPSADAGSVYRVCSVDERMRDSTTCPEVTAQ